MLHNKLGINNMKLDDIYIVLCRPDESRNIGSTCRAMANMGMKNLRIVGKKADYDEEKVKTLAIHAFSIWENAVFFDSIEEATKDCYVSAGTTRRRGKKRKEWLLTPDEFSTKVNDIENGKVIPVTLDEMKICAELENGYVVEEKDKGDGVDHNKFYDMFERNGQCHCLWGRRQDGYEFGKSGKLTVKPLGEWDKIYKR